MSPERQDNLKRDNVVLGMAAAMGAFFMFSLMVLFAKLLSENHSVIEIAFYRNLIGILPFLFVIFALGRRDIMQLHTKPVLVISRAVIGTASLIITFFAYSLMPLAETTALLFASSLFIPVLAVFILREAVGPYRWSAVIVGFAGVLVMVRPTGDVYVLGVVVALSAALLHAILQIFLRYLGRFEKPETISFYFFVVGTLLTATAMPFIAVRPTIDELPLLLGVGLSGAAAQWMLSLAYRHAPAAVVSVFNFSSIVWATLFGFMIWNEWPTSTVVAGAVIVIASNLLIIWRESRRSSPS
jgi:drug/metabolite transporter (DMT)-like permease